MHTFTPGLIYACNSIGDSNCWWFFEVVDRTPKTITIKQAGNATPYRRKIGPTYDGRAECCAPLGSHSMAPALTAGEPVTVLHRRNDGTRRPYATRAEAEAIAAQLGGTIEDIVIDVPALLTEADAIRITAGRDDWTIAGLASLRSRCDRPAQERLDIEIARVKRLALLDGLDIGARPYGVEMLGVAVNDSPRSLSAMERAERRWGMR